MLGLLLPPLVAQMKAFPKMAYANRADEALARALGWLVAEGQASALTQLSVPDILGSSITANSPTKSRKDLERSRRCGNSGVSQLESFLNESVRFSKFFLWPFVKCPMNISKP